MPIHRTLAIAAALSLSACAAHAQTAPAAPIERRDPAPTSTSPTAAAAPLPQAPSTYRWPDATDVPSPHLLISTFDAFNPHPCSLLSLDEYHIVCHDGHHGIGAVYDRSLISSIQVAPTGYLAVGEIEGTAFKGGFAILGLGFLCGVDGGPVCKTPAVLGLSLIATGIGLEIAKVHNRHKQPRMLYQAAVPRPTFPAPPLAP